jgi:hypothetical protein
LCSIPATPDAQNVLSFRWRNEAQSLPSPRSGQPTFKDTNDSFNTNSYFSVIEIIIFTTSLQMDTLDALIGFVAKNLCKERGIIHRDPHDAGIHMVALLPMFPIRHTIIHMKFLRVSHGRSGPRSGLRFTTWLPTGEVFGSQCKENMQGLVPFKPLCLEYIQSSISNVWFK